MRLINLKKPKVPRNKALIFENATRLLKQRKKVLNGFESKIFPIGK